MIDVKALTESLLKQVYDYVAPALASFNEGIAHLESKLAALPVAQKGDPGESGAPGKDGAPGAAGRDGEPGVAGKDGPAGKSAYEFAVERGFAGTELQWLDSLAGKPGENGRDGLSGKDADPVDTAAIARQAAALVPAPKDGRDADPVAIAAAVEEGIARAFPGAVQKALDALMPEFVAKAAAAVPRPLDGVDGKDAPPVDLDAVARAAAALVPVPRDGADGKSADESAVIAAVTETALQRIAEIPVPKDGRDADPVDESAIVERVRSMIPEPRDGVDGRDAEPVDMDAIVARAIALIPVPKDGADGESVTIDDLRPIVEAETARWQLEFERRATDVLHRLPAPEDGKDGRDALSVDDFEVTLEGRVFTFALRCGERVVSKQIKVPFPVDRGVYRSGMKAEKGDVVTFGGSQWIAERDTDTKPPSADWRLQVRRGQDGKGAA